MVPRNVAFWDTNRVYHFPIGYILWYRNVRERHNIHQLECTKFPNRVINWCWHVMLARKNVPKRTDIGSSWLPTWELSSRSNSWSLPQQQDRRDLPGKSDDVESTQSAGRVTARVHQFGQRNRLNTIYVSLVISRLSQQLQDATEGQQQVTLSIQHWQQSLLSKSVRSASDTPMFSVGDQFLKFKITWCISGTNVSEAGRGAH